MLALTSGCVVRWVVPLVGALLVGACDGSTATSTAGASSPTATTPVVTTAAAATTTAPAPMTAKELAWLRAITKLDKNVDKVLLQGEQSTVITRSKLRSWEKVMRSCSRELARIGFPSDRLQPVYTLVEKACQQFDKGAACYAVAARYIYTLNASKTVERKLNCGATAAGDGMDLLTDAVSKGDEIKLASD